MLLLLLYVLVKFAAYTAWCALALRILDGRGPHDVRGALLWGALRLLLGVAVGLFIFVAALSMNNATRNAPLTYVAIYIPVRIAEWLLMDVLIRRRAFAWTRDLAWIAGGVVISSLADIPLGMMNHGVVPVGRPLC